MAHMFKILLIHQCTYGYLQMLRRDYGVKVLSSQYTLGDTASNIATSYSSSGKSLKKT